MNKKQRLISLLDLILHASPILEHLSPNTADIADSLLALDDPDKLDVIETVKNSFSGTARVLTESVDFVRADYWIRQIVGILLSK